jgi:hypothetical protein
MRWVDEGGAFPGQLRRNATHAPGAKARYTARPGARLEGKLRIVCLRPPLRPTGLALLSDFGAIDLSERRPDCNQRPGGM